MFYGGLASVECNESYQQATDVWRSALASSFPDLVATLMSVYEVQRPSSPHASRQVVTETLHQYTTMLEEFLREGRFSVEVDGTRDCSWLGVCTLVKRWRDFMGRVLHANSQVRYCV